MEVLAGEDLSLLGSAQPKDRASSVGAVPSLCCHQISVLDGELNCNVISRGQKMGLQDDSLYS